MARLQPSTVQCEPKRPHTLFHGLGSGWQATDTAHNQRLVLQAS